MCELRAEEEEMGGEESQKANRGVDTHGFCYGWNPWRTHFHCFLSGTAILLSWDGLDGFCLNFLFFDLKNKNKTKKTPPCWMKLFDETNLYLLYVLSSGIIGTTLSLLSPSSHCHPLPVSQMLIVSSTEPRTLRNCDPPQVHRPPTHKPDGRTVPLRPMPRLPVQGRPLLSNLLKFGGQ